MKQVPGASAPAHEPGAPGLVVVHAEPDEEFARELSDSLVALIAERALSWVDLRPVSEATIDLDRQVDERVRDAQVVLLVVSRDLSAVQYGASRELGVALRRHRDGAAVVLPVVYRPTSWREQSFGELAPLPTGGHPVVDWP
ncbi:toll/interleukin-1 receptor domain-containing protein, partial [Saccharothrix sp. MB29]|nr:toll/interleukin-1 receptor domain-containing protein [Saccharothrix sp. MB29]